MKEVESQWTAEYFNQRFDEMIKNPDLTYSWAYHNLEEEHIEKFGQTRYASYESFRQMRRKMIFDKQ